MPKERRLGSRRRVGTARRRRRLRCGWCAHCAPSWVPIRARCSGSLNSWATASSRCGCGSQADIDDGLAPGVSTAEASGSRRSSRRTGSCAGERDPEAGGWLSSGRSSTANTSDRRVHRRQPRPSSESSPSARSCAAGLQVAPSTYYAAKSGRRRRASAGRGDGAGVACCGRPTTGSTGRTSCGRPPAEPATTSAATRSPG